MPLNNLWIDSITKINSINLSVLCPSTSKDIHDDVTDHSQAIDFTSTSQYESEYSSDLFDFAKQDDFLNKAPLIKFIYQIFQIYMQQIQISQTLNKNTMQNLLFSSISVLQTIVDILANVCAFKGL